MLTDRIILAASPSDVVVERGGRFYRRAAGRPEVPIDRLPGTGFLPVLSFSGAPGPIVDPAEPLPLLKRVRRGRAGYFQLCPRYDPDQPRAEDGKWTDTGGGGGGHDAGGGAPRQATEPAPAEEPPVTPWKAAHTEAVRKMTAEAERHLKVSHPELAAEYARESERVLNYMTEGALNRFNQNVKGAFFYTDTQPITDFARGRGAELAPGKRAVGLWQSTGYLHLDGADGDSTRDIYAHEFTHAIDGPNLEISDTDAWERAWKSEIRDKNALSAYARTNPTEGFAEFGRLMFSGLRVREIAADFPLCYQHWVDHNLAMPIKPRP